MGIYFQSWNTKAKRELIQAIATEIKVTKEKITIVTEMDIPKFIEAITSIKYSESVEIAASLETLETQGIEASTSFLYTVDSRCSNGKTEYRYGNATSVAKTFKSVWKESKK